MKQKLAIHQLRTLSRLRRKADTVPLTIEERILAAHDAFLNPGMHCITVPNQQQGRILLRICLETLGKYADLGMLTMSLNGCPEQYRDVYAELERLHAFSLQESNLENYLLTSFSSDILIIEYTQELMEQAWIGKFEYLLHEYAFSHSIPVIMLLYSSPTAHKNTSH